MNTASKLAAFAAVVTVAFGAAAAVGASVGPIDVDTEDATHGTHGAGASGANDGERPRGLAVAEGGYRLVLDAATVAADRASTFGFSIVDDDAQAVTEFDELHERPLHLIVLSRNLVDYHHLHPTLDTDGHWSVDLPGLEPGSYRVFADFQPAGSTNLTLGADITVPGEVATVDVPAATGTAFVDGYTVSMSGTPAVGDVELSFTVAVDGEAVRTEPYLGAAGHLVAIRGGDLAYLHVHPHDNGTPPVVTFTGEFPTAGTYRLFFDFSHDGAVRTASFTVDVPVDEVDGHDGSATTDTHQEGH